MKLDINSKWYVVKLTLILVVITAAVALMLGLVNHVTKDQIAEAAQLKLSAALSQVMPEADVPFAEPVLVSEEATVYEATRGEELLGWCVEVSPSGYGGAVKLVVGIDTNNCVTGVSLVSHSETKGLGAKAENPEWLSQFSGRTGNITVNSGDNAIDALTGATVTSRAVTTGVNTAVSVVSELGKE